jgi:DNA-binding transcriptional regulator YhcF (GntR family)
VTARARGLLDVGSSTRARRGTGSRIEKHVSQMKSMFQQSNTAVLAQVIFEEPESEFSVRELAEKAEVSPSTASRKLDVLVENGVAERNRSRGSVIVSAPDSQAFRDRKLSFNLWKLAESGVVQELWNESAPEAVVLFGSFSKGEDTHQSDVDLALVEGRTVEPDTKVIGRQVSAVDVTLDEARDGFLETLANGIVLRGYLDL